MLLKYKIKTPPAIALPACAPVNYCNSTSHSKLCEFNLQNMLLYAYTIHDVIDVCTRVGKFENRKATRTDESTVRRSTVARAPAAGTHTSSDVQTTASIPPRCRLLNIITRSQALKTQLVTNATIKRAKIMHHAYCIMQLYPHHYTHHAQTTPSAEATIATRQSPCAARTI